MTENELENLIFETAKFHLNYGIGTDEELKNPYGANDEENEHRSQVWETVRRNVEEHWIHDLDLPEKYADAFWRSVESELLDAFKLLNEYPQIDPELRDWINK